MTHTSEKSKTPLDRTTAMILAAGQGTRMKSATPKVLHTIAGRPLLYYPVRAALDAGCNEVVVVVGHGRELVEAYLMREFSDRVKIAIQREQRGTGHAVIEAMGAVAADAQSVLVFYGDTPLVTADHVRAVAETLLRDDRLSLAFATCRLESPFGYGRIVRDDRGRVVGVREQKDLQSDAERAITEINPGIYAARIGYLRDALASLTPNNVQKELYLTDIVAFAASSALGIVAVDSPADVLVGVNDRDQLVAAEAAMYQRLARKWRLAGVTVRGDARIDDGVDIAQDAVIEAGVVLRGKTTIGREAVIDVGCVLSNMEIGDGVLIRPYSVLSDSKAQTRAQIGPFSHVRPGSVIGQEAHIGNFVEAKKTTMAKGSKANHLAYLGDGIIGENANIGAGTIFCNYDGFSKHTTVIEEGAFIGSDSQLVAPVTIGKGAYVGTGTTVTKDVPPNALAVGRAKQQNKDGYADRLRAKLKAAKERGG